ncbi:hypothetical protein [Vreelandella alkaliphila]|uniref:Uncharacterized protein n=1 Tax=Vreelandella alkaliphila TaxID=272774 RepID=A0AAJ2S546_9GAMM|nr:hypothetical protein [Halomonas alkaliphila]MDX5979550.1 hypothetical protein [Halomonas alkaliphila]
MLQADIQWREQYVSHALNRKFTGIIPTGIYEGFVCKASGYRLTVGEAGASNTAVVESNGYSITVRLTEPEVVEPTAAKPYVVIDARYQMGMTTIARLIAVAEPASHHLVLCKVTDTGSRWQVDTVERHLAKTVRLDGAIAEMAAAQIDQMHRFLQHRDEAKNDADSAQEGAEKTARALAASLSARITQNEERRKREQALADQKAVVAMAITGTAAINTMTRQITMLDRLMAVEKAAGI